MMGEKSPCLALIIEPCETQKPLVLVVSTFLLYEQKFGFSNKTPIVNLTVDVFNFGFIGFTVLFEINL